MSRSKHPSISRRHFNQQVVGATAALVAVNASAADETGAIRGEPTAEKVGLQILAAGGNAIDAVVAAALTAAVVVPHQTGIGGYGGHMTLAVPEGNRARGTEDGQQRKRITSIDFNSMAPAAAKDGMFPLDSSGKV